MQNIGEPHLRPWNIAHPRIVNTAFVVTGQRHRVRIRAMKPALLPAICLGLTLLVAGPACAAETVALGELAKPGRLLILRHAHAPGTGDPPTFQPDDCATQRNLDETGRKQAMQLGERLARAGVTQARVYSSQWCRCLDTARLLKLGTVEPLPALNSFFGRPQEREPNITALREILSGLPLDGPPVIMVTHQVTISAFTEESTPSGGGSLFQLNGTGNPRWLGTIPAH